MRLLMLSLSALLICGCASTKPVEFPVSPPIATAYAGGKTILNWETEAGVIYTVYYTDTPRGRRPEWKPLPQADRITGTGEPVSVNDDSGKTTRRYLLLTGDNRPY